MSHEVKEITAAQSIEHDGVNIPGRMGAILGVVSLALIAMGLTIDEWWAMREPTADVGLAGVETVYIGNRFACIDPRIELLDNSRRKVCINWDRPVTFSSVEMLNETTITVTTTIDAGVDDDNATLSPSTAPSASPSSSPSTTPTMSPTDDYFLSNSTEEVDPTGTTMCDRLGGDSFCRLQFAGWIMNLFAVFAGLVGDINSEKLIVNQYSCLLCALCTTLSVVCWILLKLIYLDDKFDGSFDKDVIGVSLWLNVGGAAAAFLAYYLCKVDREHYPTTPRYGFMNDGLGPLARIGALFGFMAWIMLLASSVLPFWSETDQLGSPEHYEEVYLDNVAHATWGLQEFCIQLPISVLNGEEYDVCMRYEESVVFTRDDRPDAEMDGCTLFRDDENGLDVCGIRLATGIAAGIAAFFAIVGDVFSEKSFHNVVTFTIVGLSGTAATVMWWVFFQGKISGPKVYAAASEVYAGPGLYLCLFGTVSAWVCFLAYLADCCGLTRATYDSDDDGDDDDDETYIDKNFTCNDCIEEMCYGSDLGPFISYSVASEDKKKTKAEENRFRTEDAVRKDSAVVVQPTSDDGQVVNPTGGGGRDSQSSGGGASGSGGGGGSTNA